MYDFTSMIDRRNQDSFKWELMKSLRPDLPREIIPFSIADMEFKNPPEITRGLQDCLEDLVLGYPARSGSYLNAVCGWMKKRHGWEINPDWIVESHGVIPAFYNAIRTFSAPGDGIIVMPPVYYPFYGAIEKNGRVIVENPLSFSQGRYHIDFDGLEEKARNPKTKVLLFCSPHNPVGRVWKKEELQRVNDICLRNHILVISDEIHFDLVMPGHKHTVFSLLSPEAEQNSLICTSPSKTFNIAGLQTANIIIPNDGLRAQYSAELSKVGLKGVNILGYKACQLAYEKCEGWLNELLTVIDENRRFSEEFIKAEIPGIAVSPMEGTYLQWWDCRSLGMNPEKLESFMTTEANLFLDEGYIFGKAGRGFERINLACPAKILEAALKRLQAAVKRL